MCQSGATGLVALTFTPFYQAVAIEYGMHIDRLVLESASPGLKTNDERVQRCAVEDAWAEEMTGGPFEDYLRRWYDQPLFGSLHAQPERLEALIQRRMDNDPQALADVMIALGTGRQAPYWDDLEEHLIPTLAIAGALDPKYLGIAKRMKGLCREIELAIVPGCGHNVHFENPAAYTERLIAFLEG